MCAKDESALGTEDAAIVERGESNAANARHHRQVPGIEFGDHAFLSLPAIS